MSEPVTKIDLGSRPPSSTAVHGCQPAQQRRRSSSKRPAVVLLQLSSDRQLSFKDCGLFFAWSVTESKPQCLLRFRGERRKLRYPSLNF